MGGAGRNQGGGDLYTRISIIRIKSCSSANDFVQSEGQARAGRPREGKGVDSGHQVPTSPMSLALGRPLGQPHLRSPPLCSAHPACRGLGWGLGKGRDQDELRSPRAAAPTPYPGPDPLPRPGPARAPRSRSPAGGTPCGRASRSARWPALPTTYLGGKGGVRVSPGGSLRLQGVRG